VLAVERRSAEHPPDHVEHVHQQIIDPAEHKDRRNNRDQDRDDRNGTVDQFQHRQVSLSGEKSDPARPQDRIGTLSI